MVKTQEWDVSSHNPSSGSGHQGTASSSLSAHPRPCDWGHHPPAPVLAPRAGHSRFTEYHKFPVGGCPSSNWTKEAKCAPLKIITRNVTLMFWVALVKLVNFFECHAVSRLIFLYVWLLRALNHTVIQFDLSDN